MGRASRTAFDIATGYFEIGALLALDGKWQPLDKIRILMGAEIDAPHAKALLEAVQGTGRRDARRQHRGRQGDATRSSTACRRSSRRCGPARSSAASTTKDKFHAKAYITHAKLEVVGAQALVGS